MTGNLPKKLTIFARAPRKITVTWDDAEDEMITFNARPAFIADSNRPKTLETGRSWAKQEDYEYVDGKYKKIPASNVLEFEIDNTSDFNKDLKITGLEKRDKGGRAYKVVINYNGECYYVDMREDVLLDVILNGTIKLGKPDCDFVWGKVGSQMKLVRVESKLYDDLIKATALDEAPRFSLKDLRVGDVFEPKTGGAMVFIGWVSTVKMNVKDVAQAGWAWKKETHFDGFEYLPKVQLWYDTYHFQDIKDINFNKLNLYHFKIKKSASIKNRVKTIAVPDDIVDRAIKLYERSLTHDSDGKPTKYFERLDYLASACEYIHIAEPNQKASLNNFYTKYKEDYEKV